MSAAASELSSGLGFTEGPLWLGTRGLLVTSISRGILHRLDPDSGAILERIETGGNPSGLCRNRQGTIWIAQGGAHVRSSSLRPAGPSIQRLTTDGQIYVVARDLTAPNDCAIGPDGLIWFTDPAGSAMEPLGEPGRVMTLDPERAWLEILADGIRYPNGLAFGPGGEVFYLAETGTARILRYRLNGSGIYPEGIHCQLTEGHPDGLAVDVTGNLYVAATDASAVLVFDREGAPAGRIDLGEGAWPTNLCFGGEDLRTLFITAAKGGRVMSVRVPEPGLELFS